MAAGLQTGGVLESSNFPSAPDTVVLLTGVSAAQLSTRQPRAPARLLHWPRKPSCAIILVMAEPSCIWTDDPVICPRKVRIPLQIPQASQSISLVALTVSHPFQHVKPPLQEYYWVWGRKELLRVLCLPLLPSAFYFTTHPPRGSRQGFGLRIQCCIAHLQNWPADYLQRNKHSKKCIKEHLHPPVNRFFVKDSEAAFYKISEIHRCLLLDNREFLRNVRQRKVYIHNTTIAASNIV